MSSRRTSPSDLDVIMLIVATMVLDRAWPSCLDGLFAPTVDRDPDGARR